MIIAGAKRSSGALLACFAALTVRRFHFLVLLQIENMPAAILAFGEDLQFMMGFIKAGYRLNCVWGAVS